MSELDQYDYELPRQLIAQRPAAARVDARLLVVDRGQQSLTHHHIRDLPEILRTGDCLVLNDTRVVPARLLGRRESTGGHWEGLFLEAGEGGFWRVLCKARGKLAVNETIRLVNAQGQDDIELRLGAKQEDGSWIVPPQSQEETFTLLERVGRVPLPPYIRKGEMDEADRQQYQTVYARWPGAVAAPTAGLHFSQPLLRRLEEDHVAICPLTLHTGAGTFRPISAAMLAEHKMHAEWGTIGPETRGADRRVPRGRRPVRGGGNHVRSTLGNRGRRRYTQAIQRSHRPFHSAALSLSCRGRPVDKFSFAADHPPGAGPHLWRRRSDCQGL